MGLEGPAAKQSENPKSGWKPTESKAASLQPVAQGQVVTNEAAPCAQNAGNALKPLSARDQLEGYEPQYFLKEDGKA
jgi:hypothetical protein